MPRKPRVPCSQPGCPELTNGGPCAAHARQRNAQREERGTGARGVQWARRRKAFLYAHPWCVLCGRQAVVADHWPKSRKQLQAEGVSDPDAAKHLRPLCVSCHNKETAKHQPGGWAAERQPRRRFG